MTHLLGAEQLHLSYPTKTVFDSLTVGVGRGDRIGVVGRNGDGKSTLLGLLSGRLEPDAGLVTRRGGLRVGELHQRDNLDDSHSVRTALVGDTPEHVWAANPQIRQVMDGLVADLNWDATIGTLSGGQRRRVALASLLIGDYDLLLLDEPTNHLDMEAITWLANHLRARWAPNEGALLVVTHDRWFLDAVAGNTWEVHGGKITQFEGGYAAYVQQRVERDRQEMVAESKRQNLLRKELAWLARGAPARTSKPKFRLDAAKTLIADVPPLRDTIELQRLASSRLGKKVVDIEGMSVAFEGTPVLEDVTLLVGPGDRIGILGANGSGKSTLLKTIAGEVTPSQGRVRLGKTVQLGVLDQSFSQLQNIGDQRVSEVLGNYKTAFLVDGKELSPAALLERLGFSPKHLSARVADLSGGQRRRLQLLLVLLEEPNVLLLDEPTNDVDAEMLTAMEELLDSFPGTLLVVSHDRYLLERVTDNQYGIVGGKLRHFPSGVEQYLQVQEEYRGLQTTPDTPADATDPTRLSGAERADASRRLASVERRLNKLRQEITKKEETLAMIDPTHYQELTKATQELGELNADLSVLEDEWLELAETLASA